MDARILQLLPVTLTVVISSGAAHRTRNFVVKAPTAAEAQTVAEAAEHYRRELAIHWLGKPLPNWRKPCRVTVKSGCFSAAGHTTFQFVGREVVNWRMMVRGTPERILDSVLPHEVNHTIFACYFRRPLPRWADEGAATLFEHPSEQRIQLQLLRNVVERDSGFIPLRKLLNMKEYPRGHRPMLILYAEGFALVDFLIQQNGGGTYLKFLSDSRRHGWESAIRRHYNHDGIEALERDWRAWILAGMPRYGAETEALLAQGESPHRRTAGRVGSTPNTPLGPEGNGHVVSVVAPVPVSPPASRGELAVSKADRRRFRHDSSRKEIRHMPESHSTSPARLRRFHESASDETPGGRNTRRWSLQPTNFRDTTPSSNNYAPGQGLRTKRKRRTLTGATPQWAGFPGHSEFF